jgi:hypothetical protein
VYREKNSGQNIAQFQRQTEMVGIRCLLGQVALSRATRLFSSSGKTKIVNL